MRPSPYSEQVKYMVAVLWLHGTSEARIAELLKNEGIVTMSKGAVSGLINRAGDGQLRGLSLKARQHWLDTFSTRRLDKGKLGPRHFRARDLGNGRR